MTTVAPTPSSVRATPVYFGPEARPLFGWVYQPADGLSRGTVDRVRTRRPRVHQRALHLPHHGRDPGLPRHLGHSLRLRRHRRLGRRRLGPRRFDAALASIGHAIDLAKELGSAPDLASSACAWAPCWRPGRRGATNRSPAWCSGTPAARDASSCESNRPSSGCSTARPGPRTAAPRVPGFVLTADTVDELCASLVAPASLPSVGARARSSTGPTARRAAPSGSRRTGSSARWLRARRSSWTSSPSSAGADGSDRARRRLARRRAPRRSGRRSPRPATRDSITVSTPDGATVTERLVALGPHRLVRDPGDGRVRADWTTGSLPQQREGSRTRDRTACGSTSAGHGPRLGFPCYRFDLSGLGDSPVRPGQVPDRRACARGVRRRDRRRGRRGRRRLGQHDGAGRAGGVCARARTRRSRVQSTCTPSRSSRSTRSCASSRPRRAGDADGSTTPVLLSLAGNLRNAYRALPSWKMLRVRTRSLPGPRPAGSRRQKSSLDWLEERRRTAPTSSASAVSPKRRPSSRERQPIARHWTRTIAASR